MASKSGRRPRSGPSPQSSSNRRPAISTTNAAGSLGPRPDTAVRRALMSALQSPRDNPVSRWREFRHGYVFRHVVEHYFHRHLAGHVLRLDADDVSEQPRTLLELDQGDDIGHFLGEGRMIDAMKGHEAEDLAAAGHGHERKVGGKAMRAALRGRKPEFAASIAVRDFESMLFCRLPVFDRFRCRARDRFFLRLFLYLFCRLAHHARPRIRVEWQT